MSRQRRLLVAAVRVTSASACLALVGMAGAHEPAHPAGAAVGELPVSSAVSAHDVGAEAADGAEGLVTLELPHREVEPFRTAAYFSLGIGAVSLAVGTTFAVREFRLDYALDGMCQRRSCRQNDEARASRLWADLKRMRGLSSWGLGAAAVSFAVGSALLSMGSAERRVGSVRYRAWVGAGALGLTGRF